MAPIQSDDESLESGGFVSGSEIDAPVDQANGAQLEDGEEEFHTEDSDGSEADIGAEAESENEDESDLENAVNAPGIPLLPSHLLKSQPKPVVSAPALASIPWDQLTAKQKKARRSNSRKMKKRTYDRLREETKGTGTLEAGKVAQVKRNVIPAVWRKVRSGRVEKKRGAEGVRASGRQAMVEERKRDVRKSAVEPGGIGRRRKGSAMSNR